MEQAVWVDWRDGCEPAAGADRIYFGHETCQDAMPPVDRAESLARRCREARLPLTLVTPPLTDAGLRSATGLVEALARVAERLEVVCGDWGLLRTLARDRIAVPVIGRVLGARPADPRIARLLSLPGCPPAERRIQHLDGTVCALRHRPPPPDLVAHYRGCWLDKPSVRSFFSSLGVSRCELSNAPQGFDPGALSGWTCSLHASDVLVAVARSCPGGGVDFSRPAVCPGGDCPEGIQPWTAPGWPVPLYRCQNAVFCAPPEIAVAQMPACVDRVVRRPGREAASREAGAFGRGSIA